MRATIRDVALQAGVSIKTVSRVLNNERYVRSDTRERVQQAVRALDFHPSLAARALSGRRGFQIGLVCDNPNPYYVHELQKGIRARAEADDVRLVVQPYDRAEDRLFDDIAALIAEVRFDGLILTPPVTDRSDVLDLLLNQGHKVVRVQPGSFENRTPATAINNRDAAQTMVARLVDFGHRRIGYVGGPAEYAVSADRERGYRLALERAGIPIEPGLICSGDFSLESGAAAAVRLIPAGATAIFASSDSMAAGVLGEAHRQGLRLPDDLSVAGFDDSALASSVWPPLTTVRQPLSELGWQAADLLLSDKTENVCRMLPFEIIERGSVAPR